ncbi:transglutaminase domain-containing protein [Caenimonas sedimenti]|nr:transglutaminase domain-containing protein [Caenimonas sedimenti]
MSEIPASRPMPNEDDPGLWLGSSPLLDLADPKLRLRAQALTQLCKSERERALAVYRFVKRIPFSRPFKMRLHTAREVVQQDRADSADKAALLVALLRLAEIPARVRYLTLRSEMMRGLVDGPDSMRPVVEVFRERHWVGTDTYIFDASYTAAARTRLRAYGWERGYGMDADGDMLWDGTGSAYVGKSPPREDPMVLQDHGVFCDTLEFVSSPQYRAAHSRLGRAVQWNMLAAGMERAIRELREDPHGLGALHFSG